MVRGRTSWSHPSSTAGSSVPRDHTSRWAALCPGSESLSISRSLLPSMARTRARKSRMSVEIARLAAAGIFAVVFAAVTDRRHEFGVRRALGTSSNNIVMLAIGSELVVCLGGIGMGVVAAFWATRLIAGQLYGVTPMDPITIASVALGLTGVTWLACYLPARLAAKVNPATLLRSE